MWVLIILFYVSGYEVTTLNDVLLNIMRYDLIHSLLLPACNFTLEERLALHSLFSIHLSKGIGENLNMILYQLFWMLIAFQLVSKEKATFIYVNNLYVSSFCLTLSVVWSVFHMNFHVSSISHHCVPLGYITHDFWLSIDLEYQNFWILACVYLRSAYGSHKFYYKCQDHELHKFSFFFWP